MIANYSKRPSLSRVLLQLISVRLFLPLMLLGLAAFAGAAYWGKQNIESQQHQVAQSTAQLVDRYLDQSGRILDAVARTAETATPKELLVFMQSTWSAYGHFDTIYNLDKNNRIRLAVPSGKGFTDLDMSRLPYFQEIDRRSAEKNKPLISRPFMSFSTGELTVYLIMPLSRGGAIVGELNLKSLQQEIAGGIGKMRKDTIFVMDQSGMLLAHPSSEPVKQQANLSYLEIFQRGLKGDVTLVYQYEGTRVLASTAKAEKAGWVVVNQISLFTAVGSYVLTLGLTLLAALGVWLALVWNLRQKIQRDVLAPLVRFGEGTAALANGDFGKSAVLTSGTIVFEELNKLAEDFQHMCDALQAREAALAESRNYLDKIINSAADPIFVKDRQHRWVLLNDAFCSFMGRRRDELLGKLDYDFFPKDEADVFWAKDETVFMAGAENTNEEKFTDAKGVVHSIVTKKTLYTDEKKEQYIVGMISDMTERKRLEAELRQSQKMETVGLLAGGIAHDFNNLLTPILGYADLLILGLPEGDHRREQLQQVKQAGERAKDLTRRLLAFSRKQLIELNIVDVGEIIRKFETMLRRTIRENIQIEIRISPSLSKVRADVGQIEQALVNLSINAQDAMPEGGTLMIEARDVDLDESYSARYPDILPGPYIMLSVSDTGVGMDELEIEHIFEPFYTTKELGRGTGLGLSTVYGIVKQHGGLITINSEKSRGSTFKVFLPRATEEGARIEEQRAPSANGVAHGAEIILVAEDNEMVRTLACKMLEDLGYQVLSAANPDQCIEIAKTHEGTINLLLTDVVMPKMNGKDLYDVLHRMRPDLKVLFMSGYTSNVIGHHGVLDEGVGFIQKPFSVNALAQKVRAVLEA